MKICNFRSSFLSILFLGGWMTSLTPAQTLNWQLAVPQAIEINGATEAWHSGRVLDSIDFADGSVLLATSSSGLWWANKNGDARSLTDDWRNPDLQTIERGSDGQFHIYAATAQRRYANSQLYENSSPDLTGWQPINLPSGVFSIRDINVLRRARKIILACDNGIFWATIPPPGARRVYEWRAATGVDAAANYWMTASKATGGKWGEMESPTDDYLSDNQEIAAVARTPVNRDAFWINSRGEVRGSWHVVGGNWTGHTFSATAPNIARADSKLAAIARTETHLDVFFAGRGGELMTTWWDAADGNWQAHTYPVFRTNTVHPGGAITAVARTPEDIDVFWVAADLSIKHTAWSTRTGSWTAAANVAPPNGAAAGTRIAVVSRLPNLLDVFWIAPNGEIKTNGRNQNNLPGWTYLQTIPSNGAAAVTGGIAVVAREADKLDLVWTAADGRLMTSWWHNTPEGWSNHAYALSAPNAASLTGNVTLISRNPLQLDVFWRATDLTIRSNYWHQNDAPRFPTQSFALVERNNSANKNLIAVSGSDEEISLYSVAGDNSMAVRQWNNDAYTILAGRQLNNNRPVVKGEFSGENLNLTAANFTGGDGNYSTTSVAVSKYANAAYALIAKPDGSVKDVYRSDNLGATWRRAGTTVTNEPDCNDRGVKTLQTCAGGQGTDWNNTIAVSPVNNETVYAGFVKLYSTFDGGNWRFLASEHVHADIARINFGEYDRTGKTVYFATDGGISATFDGRNSVYLSRFNKNLTTLQCYTTDGLRQFAGTLGASYQKDFLIGTGLQDNGNVWSVGGRAWRQIDGGDGGYFTFMRNGISISRSMDGDFGWAEWNGTTLDKKGLITVDKKKPNVPNPPNSLRGEYAIVNSPVAWDASGAKIYGFNWDGKDIHSFWNPTGGKGWRWEYETTAPLIAGEFFSAGSSADGQNAFFATSNGRIFQYNRRANQLTASTVNLTGIADSGEYGINRLVMLSDTLGYALLNNWRAPAAGNVAGLELGYVLRFDGTSWTPIRATLDGGAFPIERHYSLDNDWTTNPMTLVLTTDDRAYVSRDAGATWQNQSTNLPRRAHLSDVRFVVFPNGTKRFYLSTYGRSVWYADVR